MTKSENINPFSSVFLCERLIFLSDLITGGRLLPKGHNIYFNLLGDCSLKKTIAVVWWWSEKTAKVPCEQCPSLLIAFSGAVQVWCAPVYQRGYVLRKYSCLLSRSVGKWITYNINEAHILTYIYVLICDHSQLFKQPVCFAFQTFYYLLEFIKFSLQLTIILIISRPFSQQIFWLVLLITLTKLCSLTTALFSSNVPVRHDSVTVSQHAQHLGPETEAAKRNTVIIKCTVYTSAYTCFLIFTINWLIIWEIECEKRGNYHCDFPVLKVTGCFVLPTFHSPIDHHRRQRKAPYLHKR